MPVWWQGAVMIRAGTTNYDIVHLSDITIPQLRLIKETVKWLDGQDHSRWVFQAPGHYGVGELRDSYLKIWNPTHIRRDNVLRGIEVGFYDDSTTPALRALIFHDRICRGYVMDRCRRNRTLDTDFYRLVRARTAETGHFHVQFSPYHMMKYRGRYSLIDLEGLHPIGDLPAMPSYHCRFDWPDYQSYVTELYLAAFAPSSSVSPPISWPVTGRSRNEGGLARVIEVPCRKSRALYKRFLRWLIMMRGRVVNRIHLIER